MFRPTPVMAFVNGAGKRVMPRCYSGNGVVRYARWGGDFGFGTFETCRAVL